MEDFQQTDIQIIDCPYNKSPNASSPAWDDVNKLIKKLNECFEKEQENFVYICFYLRQLKTLFDSYDDSYYGRYFDVSKNYVFYDTLYKAFGLSDKDVQRLLNIYGRFIVIKTGAGPDDVVPKLMDDFFGFSKSKLIELLPLSNEQIKKAMSNQLITYKSTCKEIRQYVKSLKSSDKKENQVLEEPSSTDSENNVDPESPDAKCLVSVTLKKSNIDFIKTLGVDINDYINQLILDDIANRSED